MRVCIDQGAGVAFVGPWVVVAERRFRVAVVRIPPPKPIHRDGLSAVAGRCVSLGVEGPMADDARRDVYVVALLGESPAVVTELLWHLVVRERRRVTGVELWTTDRGQARLRELGAALFASLARALGPAASSLPSWDADFRAYNGTDRPPAGGFLVFVPRMADGQNLEDVATSEEAWVFSSWAHLRFRVLERVAEPIVCAIGGGRIVMSALTHSAFTMFARPVDRLVHSVLHPIVEAAVDRRRFACPRALPGVDIPVERQLTVCAIPVFSVRAFVEGDGRRTAGDLVAAMRDAMARAAARGLGPTLAMRRIPRGRVLVWLGGNPFTCSLPYAVAYLLLIEAPDGLEPTTLLRRANEASGGNGALDPESVTRSLRNLRLKFQAAAGTDPELRSLVPRVRGDLWVVAPELGIDVDPAALRAALFPTGT